MKFEAEVSELLREATQSMRSDLPVTCNFNPAIIKWHNWERPESRF